MSSKLNSKRKPFDKFVSIASMLSAHGKSRENHTIRFCASANSDSISLQTHCSLVEAQITANLYCEQEFQSNLDVEFQIDTIASNLSALPSAYFLQLNFDEECLELHAATFNGGLLQDIEDSYCAIDTHAKNIVLVKNTELLTNYLLESKNLKQPIYKLNCRENHLSILRNIYCLMTKSSKPAESKFQLTSDDNFIYIELFVADIYARFKLFEQESDCEVKIVMENQQLKFLKFAMSVLMKEPINSVELNCDSGTTMMLKSDNICCNFKNLSSTIFFESPAQLDTDGWCEESNSNLQNALSLIDVASRSIDDIVTIQVKNGQLHAEVKTDHSLGSFCSKMTFLNNSVSGPAFVLSRTQLESALNCFNSYEILQLHGLLTHSSRLIIKSSFSNNIVMLSITEPRDRDPA